VLNNSYAWTEEIAVNCLIGVVFLGAVMCVRTSRHIQVDVFYHYMPAGLARVLATFVDIVRIGFFAYGCYLMWRYVQIVADEQMVTVDLPRNIVFYSVLAAFVLMLIRAVIVFIANMRRGYSVLERPEEFHAVEG
jgi:TRAP-type C4-dicarboxylate transport system permease small subunit